MEFPGLGERCQNEDCKQNDFLPLQCKCGKVFCREHFSDHCTSGSCEMAPKPKDIILKNDDEIFRCNEKGCKKGNLHEMLCIKCNKHYCIDHRFHPSCPEIDDETLAAKIEQYDTPRKQFHEANKHLQQKITENIWKALQSSVKVKTATKIHLMRIKQRALGPKTIPVSDRVYFAIKKPASVQPKAVKIVTDVENVEQIETVALDPDLKDTVSVFISSKWSLGRVLDSICDTCNIKNDNNTFGDVKLRIFRQLDGYCISPVKMDVEIAELISKEILLEGDKLVVEYIGNSILSDLDENTHLFLSS